MGSKKSDSVQWWDRGRERWRSRAAKKERSYDECVGGKRRPSRDTYPRRDPSVRVALRQYCHERDEDALDVRLAREHGPAPWWLRWRHTVRRRVRIAVQESMACGFLLQLHRRRRQLPRECRRFAAYVDADWSGRIAIAEELLAALDDNVRAGVGKRTPLSEDPRLILRVPARGERLKIARHLLRAHARWQRRDPVRVAARALWPLVQSRAAAQGEPESKRRHRWLALLFASMLDWLPVAYTQRTWRWSLWSARAFVREAFEREPALREAFERWTALNLPSERELATMLARSDTRGWR